MARGTESHFVIRVHSSRAQASRWRRRRCSRLPPPRPDVFPIMPSSAPTRIMLTRAKTGVLSHSGAISLGAATRVALTGQPSAPSVGIIAACPGFAFLSRRSKCMYCTGIRFRPEWAFAPACPSSSSFLLAASQKRPPTGPGVLHASRHHLSFRRAARALYAQRAACSTVKVWPASDVDRWGVALVVET